MSREAVQMSKTFIDGYGSDNMSGPLAISEGRNCKSYMIKGVRCLITGAMSTGQVEGWMELYAQEVIPEAEYRKLHLYDRDPADSERHWKLVNDGRRERGYGGMKVKCDGERCVFTDRSFVITPLPNTGYKQTELFTNTDTNE